MNCNFTCIGLEAKICGETFECSKIDVIYIITVLLSIISSFVSMLCLLATDDVLCSLSKYQCVFLTIGSIIAISITILNVRKGPYHSKEEHMLVKTISCGVITTYFIMLCGVIYCKCCSKRKACKNTKKCIRQNGQLKNYKIPPSQVSIQQEANNSA